MIDDSDSRVPAAFPATRHTIVRTAASADPNERRAALECLVGAYWKPIYKYLRLRWQLGIEDAQDLTQEFLARAMEKGFFVQFDPAKARLRTFLRVGLDAFVGEWRTAATRLKRGGGLVILALDFEAAETDMRRVNDYGALDPDETFRREWVRDLLTAAVDDLRQELGAAGRESQFGMFERYDLHGDGQTDRPTYADLAAQFGTTVSQVTNSLAAARRRFRELFLERLSSCTADEDDFGAEARRLFGRGVS